MKFRERLTERRQAANLSQAELARRSGFTRQSIADWESGRRQNISLKNMIKLAQALDMTFEQFARGIDEAESSPPAHAMA